MLFILLIISHGRSSVEKFLVIFVTFIQPRGHVGSWEYCWVLGKTMGVRPDIHFQIVNFKETKYHIQLYNIALIIWLIFNNQKFQIHNIKNFLETLFKKAHCINFKLHRFYEQLSETILMFIFLDLPLVYFSFLFTQLALHGSRAVSTCHWGDA
jgi:hypothetical protein